ncbi:DUF1643 domain-containing protein [Trichocoleus sp. Lan]
MLNPSTADEEKNDPTILSVCRLAKNGGFGRLLVLNLLGVRATNPFDIWAYEDPLGVDNYRTWDRVLKEELIPGVDTISVAWGRAPKERRQLLHFIPALAEAYCRLKPWRKSVMTWVQNIDGSPRHPLYISGRTELQPYDLDSYVKDILQRNNTLLSNNLKDFVE